MRKLEDNRMERMRNNSAINETEYAVIQSKTASGTYALPPPPTLEELRRQVEAEKASK
ncbi:MAG: hypothetical protein LBV12_11050 [Puniceicoccales bacterium]|nr:hypothetical protein [Puniceicoccales bacterium]